MNHEIPQRRRSARLTSPTQNVVNVDKMAPIAAVKRSITVRKIAPRKTVVPSDHNKENLQRLSEGIREKNTKISTPSPVQATPPRKGPMPSPILASSPPPLRPQPAPDPENAVWSQKVRRSYSRLSDPAFNNAGSRESLFGFDRLKTPEVFRKVGQSSLELGSSLSGISSFTTLIDGEDIAGSFAEPDLNIPGVVVFKEKRRRKKVQQIDIKELDSLAAEMNAEFEEAEGFELVVE